MRLILAAAALTAIASPAAAQRLDTRRIDIRDTPSTTTCIFNAYRELRLVDGSKGGHTKVATWAGASAEDPGVQMRIAFQRGENWRTPPFLGIAFTVPTGGKLTQEAVGGAQLSIDGEGPIPLQYNASGDKLLFPVNRDLDAVGARMIESKSVTLEIRDSAGATLRRYAWDTHRFDEAFETIFYVGWSCTSP